MLEAHGISVSFGGVAAVSDVSLSVDAGEVLAIVGPNGSGKTTLLNAINGLVPSRGSARLDGVDFPLGRTLRTARCGVARTFQTPQVLDHLSCLDNVLLSAADHRSVGLFSAWLGRRTMMIRERERWLAAIETLERFGLGGSTAEPASRLSYGQRRWLELARVAVARPKYLLADEPSAGLNDAETDALAEHLASFRNNGVGIVLVDHKIEFLRKVADRAIVLALGNKVAESDIESVWDLAEVREAYLGSRHAGR